jgi:hypothetical protein
MTTPTPTIYRSRWKTNRRRLLMIAAVLALVLAGFLIGRLRGSSPAAGSTVPPPPSSPGSPAASVPPSSAPSSPPPTTAGGIDAYAPLQAESAAALSGIQREDTADVGGGQDVGWITNGDSMRFDTVNFGDTPASQLIARVASAADDKINGRMEIRIDSPDSAPIGSLPIKNTGGWQTWVSLATDISGVTGVHTVFLTFAADGGGDFVNVNYLKFSH